MTDLSRDIVNQRTADVIAVGSIPTSIWLWLEWADLILRVSVGLGSLILIGFAIRVKVRHWRGK